MPVADPDLAGVVWEEGGREAPPYPGSTVKTRCYYQKKGMLFYPVVDPYVRYPNKRFLVVGD